MHRSSESSSSQAPISSTKSSMLQIISMSHKDDRVYIYVTDYTSRSDLAPIYIDPPTDVSVPTNSVVKVLLLDGQATTAKTLEPGDFVSVRNLRLKGSNRADGVEDNLSGKLGGDQRLIFKLQPQGTGNEDLLALLRWVHLVTPAR